ncbi:DUF805 domain-containing protein [Aliiroseovarius crassostreae]|uniref:DUF805 domain-containing protein n=1 Tax=Aliiroseovarius crassostreae TaxID=154981 RepID=UPI000A936559|nr:DUF805 domain-containing protein [Aliiroseovarius crassostreae]
MWLATVLPYLAAATRRLHDTSRSGWWLLLGFVPLIGGIILIVFLALHGTRGDNRYGPDPLDGAVGGGVDPNAGDETYRQSSIPRVGD